jgi:receptor protein-tyrosine kinase
MDLIEKAVKKRGRANEDSIVERAAEKLRGEKTVGGSTEDASAATAPPVDQPSPKSNEAAQATGEGSASGVHVDLRRVRAAGMVTPNDGGTRTGEVYRVVKRRLLRRAFFDRGPTKNGNLIMVTSSKPKEGKSFTAISLAMSMTTERDAHVLLVDADINKPSVPSALGIDAPRGLVDVLENESLELRDVILRTDVEHLSVLPTGRAHPLASELLASKRMEQLIKDIATRYSDRIIIFDSPPILSSSVPTVLAQYVGQIVLVVEACKTRPTAIKAALDLIGSCQDIKLLLNKAPFVPGNEEFGVCYEPYYNKYQ